MKIAKIILIIIGVLVGLFLIITLLLPSKYEVMRTADIKAPTATVFDMVNDLHNWEKWDPWMALDTAQTRTFEGTGIGKGSSYSWDSKNEQVGKGTLSITESVKPEYVNMELTFEKQKMGEGTIKLEEKNGMTTVTWTMSGDVGFFWRWVGLMMDGVVGPMFEQGLSKLKNLCENPPMANIDIQVTELQPQTILFIRDSIPMDPKIIGEAMGKAYKELTEFIGKNNIECTSEPVAITNSYDEKSWNFDAGIPIKAKSIKLEGRIKLGSTPSGKVVKAVHVGPYENEKATYDAIMKYIKDKNLKIRDRSWEAYVTDPHNVPQDKLITHIFFPVY